MWSSDEMRMAADMYQAMFLDQYGEDGPEHARLRVLRFIGARIGRTAYAVESRCNVWGANFGLKAERGRRLSTEAERKRVAYLAALDQRDPVAMILGDPPPGYSALDRRRAGVRP